jgi:hemerythrin superfamily protein
LSIPPPVLLREVELSDMVKHEGANMDNSDRERLLRDADEFEELVAMLIEHGVERDTAERVVIHSGHKRIEQLFAEYIKARGDNSGQLKGLLDKILKSNK